MPAPKMDGPTATILRTLAAHPGATYAQLAEAAYGSTSLEARLKVGNIIGSLYRRGVLKKHGERRGSYAVRAEATRCRAGQLATTPTRGPAW